MDIITRFFKDEQFDAINNIARWAKYRRIKDETVAHHSFVVSLFADFITEELFEKADSVNSINFKLKVVRASLRHDMGEMITGDVDHEVKNNNYNGKTISNALDEYMAWELKKKFKSGRSEDLFIKSIDYYDDGAVKSIVKIADWLSCLLFIHKEKQLGNTTFDSKLKICKESCMTWITKSKEIMLTKFDSKELNLKIYDDISFLIYKL